MEGVEEKLFVERVKEFLAGHRWSMSTLAKAAGLSKSALSQFLSHQYNGDNNKVRVLLEDILARERDKSAQPKTVLGFVDTSVSKNVFEVAKYCHLLGDIGVCYSTAGLGKTESVREYAKRHSDVLLIEANPGYTAKYLMQELREILGGSSRLNMLDTFMDCCNRLSDSGRLLIVDEAEQLPYKALEMLRRLHDKTGIGILLTGMPKLLANLKGLKGEYAQLYSRVGIAYSLKPIKESDSVTIIKVLLPEIGASVAKVFHRESGGITRRLVKIIRRVKHVATINGRDIDEELVKYAASLVKMEVMS